MMGKHVGALALLALLAAASCATSCLGQQEEQQQQQQQQHSQVVQLSASLELLGKQIAQAQAKLNEVQVALGQLRARLPQCAAPALIAPGSPVQQTARPIEDQRPAAIAASDASPSGQAAAPTSRSEPTLEAAAAAAAEAASERQETIHLAPKTAQMDGAGSDSDDDDDDDGDYEGAEVRPSEPHSDDSASPSSQVERAVNEQGAPSALQSGHEQPPHSVSISKPQSEQQAEHEAEHEVNHAIGREAGREVAQEATHAGAHEAQQVMHETERGAAGAPRVQPEAGGQFDAQQATGKQQSWAQRKYVGALNGANAVFKRRGQGGAEQRAAAAAAAANNNNNNKANVPAGGQQFFGAPLAAVKRAAAAVRLRAPSDEYLSAPSENSQPSWTKRKYASALEGGKAVFKPPAGGQMQANGLVGGLVDNVRNTIQEQGAQAASYLKGEAAQPHQGHQASGGGGGRVASPRAHHNQQQGGSLLNKLNPANYLPTVSRAPVAGQQQRQQQQRHGQQQPREGRRFSQRLKGLANAPRRVLRRHGQQQQQRQQGGRRRSLRGRVRAVAHRIRSNELIHGTFDKIRRRSLRPLRAIRRHASELRGLVQYRAGELGRQAAAAGREMRGRWSQWREHRRSRRAERGGGGVEFDEGQHEPDAMLSSADGDDVDADGGEYEDAYQVDEHELAGNVIELPLSHVVADRVGKMPNVPPGAH